MIEPVSNEPEQGKYLSNIFIRPKKDGGIRVILNLNQFNQNVVYKHFKMQSLQSAIDLMTKGCYLASVDFEDAYYICPIREQDQKYLRFMWKGQKYTYKVLPNGLSSGPKDLTKITKVLFKHLKERGNQNTSYLDDSFLAKKAVEDCCKNVFDTVKISLDAGFIVHPDKSVLCPTQIIVYLGFILYSVEMTVRLTPARIENLITSIRSIVQFQTIQIQELAKVVGKIVSQV